MTRINAEGSESLDVVIVGAGFGGLYALHKLRGLGWNARVFEAGDAIGGTWYWNRYPGARCDIESLQYSYSFDPELERTWEWTERFATQPEILRYINHVADRYDLRRDITLNSRITSAEYDVYARRWVLATDDDRRVVATYVVMATGCLSMPQVPRIAGLEEFEGTIHHTAHWPEAGVDFAGQRVGLIGTGSSAIQAIPEIAKQAYELFVFQRTPSFSVPARNAPLTPDKRSDWKANCVALRRLAREQTPTGVIYDFASSTAQDVDDATRQAEFEARWQKGGANFAYAFTDLNRDEVSNGYAADFVRRKIRELVRDPEVAEALSPRDYPIFAKRICVDTDYYVTFNRPNVTLVDLRKAALERITMTGVRTARGDYPLDALVLATGFDAITGALDRIDIRGIGGRSLKESWSEGPRTYLGLMAAGFPNLFIITGPGSPSVLSNVIAAIEQHVEWIADCLTYMRAKGARTIEPSLEAVNGWVAHVNEVASRTLFPKAASWYMGANIPGKPRVFMPYVGVGAYRRKCREIVERGYEGFVMANAALDEAVA
jgi:cyclohexanone monooxygenase